MSQNNLLDPASIKREVSESGFEYLLGEILNLPSPANVNDKASALSERLEAIGYDVGYRVIERLTNGHRYVGSDPLDLMKFICKEFWEEIFKKKIDKLQTNHRGVFVLTDAKFKWLEKYSSDDIASKQIATLMLHIPCGMIRGALADLGVLATVNADFNHMPSCTFNIRMKT